MITAEATWTSLLAGVVVNALLGLIAFLGAGLTAAGVVELTRTAWVARIAFRQWTASPGRTTVTAAAAWAVAGLAWVRGIRLALAPPS
jgi:hypothetical protein